MADITTIETVILEMIDEDLTTPDNWDGTDEVRAWVADGIDELCLFNKFYKRKLEIALSADTHIHYFSPRKEMVIGVKSMWLRDKLRVLEQTSINKIAREDPRWLATRGSPWQYFILDFEKFGIYPTYATTSQDSVEADVVMIPESYTNLGNIIGVQQEYDDALIAYAKHMLYARLGRVEQSMEEYQEFLRLAGASQIFARKLASIKERRKHGVGE